jgi:hypothetical protein
MATAATRIQTLTAIAREPFPAVCLEL